MPVRARDLKRVAADHEKTARTEAERRAVISRAYYAAYHRCLRWEKALPHKSAERPKGGCHEQLIGRLRCPSGLCSVTVADRSVALSDLLDQQRKRRITADYQLSAVVDEQAMKEQIADTNVLFQTCGE